MIRTENKELFSNSDLLYIIGLGVVGLAFFGENLPALAGLWTAGVMGKELVRYMVKRKRT